MIAKWQGCMSNECWTVITLHRPPTEICRILQIGAWWLYNSFQNCNTQGGTEFIYKSTILDEKQLHLKQDWLRSHKIPYTEVVCMYS